MTGARKENQLPMRRDLAKESLSLERTGETIGSAGENQDRHVPCSKSTLGESSPPRKTRRRVPLHRSF